MLVYKYIISLQKQKQNDMKVQEWCKYGLEEEREMTKQDLINMVRTKYKYEFSIISFRIDLENGVKEFFGDSVTIKILD